MPVLLGFVELQGNLGHVASDVDLSEEDNLEEEEKRLVRYPRP